MRTQSHQREATACVAEFTAVQDRGMLEWARRRPDDGFVIGVALRLRGPRPTAQRLAALIAARLPRLPVLTEHLDGPEREESWRPADGFDAARHVHVLDGPAQACGAVELVADQPVCEDRPRWGLWLADAERDDEYLLAYRVHHAAQDGAAVVHTVRRLLDARAAAAPTDGVPARVGRQAAAPSPGGSRLLATADVPVAAMRSVVQASGASLNDVYLAALAGALRAWLPPAERHRPVPVRVPFNVRLRHERQDRGNRFGYKQVFLPVDEPSAVRRLAAVVGQTLLWPRDRNRRLLDLIPNEMLQDLVTSFLSPRDALATVTLLGVHTPLALDGSPVTGGFALPPLVSGHLFSSVLFLHGDRAAVSFTAQAQHDHVRDLPRLWELAVAELATAEFP